LYLKIAPPWWRTNWAYLAYFLLFIGSLITASGWQRKRLLRIEEEKAQLKELEHAKEIEKAYKNLKSTQAQLIQSEKMASLGELTAGIAHEIQNPLNFVNNFSEVNTELIEELEEEIRNGDLEEIKAIAKDLRANEEKINHHGKRADAIVKGMLQHSRTRSGEKVPTDLNELVDEYLRLAYHGLRAKDSSFNAAFETNLDPDLPKVEVIPQDIGRVLLNLINNAFQAVDDERMNRLKADEGPGDLQMSEPQSGRAAEDGYAPKVTVCTKMSPLRGLGGGSDKESIVQVIVKDNGPGIPDDIKNKIFQPFFTTKPTGQGTGLGLSLSYDIVKAHGGEISVEGNEGEGTEFIITLPKQL
jgi:signal transduction histidine kinase